MAEQTNSVSVYVRVRPQLNFDLEDLPQQQAQPYGRANRRNINSESLKDECVSVCDEHMIVFDPNTGARRGTARTRRTAPAAGSRERKFVFDRVFPGTSSQNDVYEQTTKPLLTSFLDGLHVCVFAYGATGCGKTHTISGSNEQPGLIYLAISDLFARTNELSRNGTNVELNMSYMEIYNEELRDLLSENEPHPPNSEDLRQRQQRRLRPRLPQLVLRENYDSMHVANLSTHRLDSVAKAMDLIQRGNGNRATFATGSNPVSSRSHAVLRIECRQSKVSADLRAESLNSVMTVIDLAGSERASNTRNSGQRMVEGANINRSLLALGNCITALSNKRPHVPYRSSKLTRLLKESLGSNCRTAMIVCVSPSLRHIDDTSNSLCYADRAKVIKNSAVRNVRTVEVHVTEYQETIRRLQAENLFLNAELNQIKAQSAACISRQATQTELVSPQQQAVAYEPITDAVLQAVERIVQFSSTLGPAKEREVTSAVLRRSLYEERKTCEYLKANVAGERAQLYIQQRIEEISERYNDLTIDSSEELLQHYIENERDKLMAAGSMPANSNSSAYFDAKTAALLAAHAREVCAAIVNCCDGSEGLLPFIIKILNTTAVSKLPSPSTLERSPLAISHSHQGSPLSVRRRRNPLLHIPDPGNIAPRQSPGSAASAGSNIGLGPAGIRKDSGRRVSRSGLSPQPRRNTALPRTASGSPGASLLQALSLQSTPPVRKRGD